MSNAISHPARGRSVGGIVHIPLWMPGQHLRFMNYTIKGGQTLKKGSVLGQITLSGLLVLSASAAGDGSQVPMAILGEDLATFDTDGTTNLDMKFSVAVTATVNPGALVLGTGHTIASITAALRDRGIFLSAPGYSG